MFNPVAIPGKTGTTAG